MTLYEMLEKMRGRIGILLVLVFVGYVGLLTIFVAFHRMRLDEWVEVRHANHSPVDSVR